MGIGGAKVFFAKRDVSRVIISDALDVAPRVLMSCISLFVGSLSTAEQARRAYATMEPTCFGLLLFRSVHQCRTVIFKETDAEGLSDKSYDLLKARLRCSVSRAMLEMIRVDLRISTTSVFRVDSSVTRSIIEESYFFGTAMIDSNVSYFTEDCCSWFLAYQVFTFVLGW